eukprot:gene343-288_t
MPAAAKKLVKPKALAKSPARKKRVALDKKTAVEQTKKKKKKVAEKPKKKKVAAEPKQTKPAEKSQKKVAPVKKNKKVADNKKQNAADKKKAREAVKKKKEKKQEKKEKTQKKRLERQIEKAERSKQNLQRRLERMSRKKKPVEQEEENKDEELGQVPGDLAGAVGQEVLDEVDDQETVVDTIADAADNSTAVATEEALQPAQPPAQPLLRSSGFFDKVVAISGNQQSTEEMVGNQQSTEEMVNMPAASPVEYLPVMVSENSSSTTSGSRSRLPPVPCVPKHCLPYDPDWSGFYVGGFAMAVALRILDKRQSRARQTKLKLPSDLLPCLRAESELRSPDREEVNANDTSTKSAFGYRQELKLWPLLLQHHVMLSFLNRSSRPSLFIGSSRLRRLVFLSFHHHVLMGVAALLYSGIEGLPFWTGPVLAILLQPIFSGMTTLLWHTVTTSHEHQLTSGAPPKYGSDYSKIGFVDPKIRMGENRRMLSILGIGSEYESLNFGRPSTATVDGRPSTTTGSKSILAVRESVHLDNNGRAISFRGAGLEGATRQISFRGGDGNMETMIPTKISDTTILEEQDSGQVNEDNKNNNNLLAQPDLLGVRKYNSAMALENESFSTVTRFSFVYAKPQITKFEQ